jgi:hypothetical protein
MKEKSTLTKFIELVMDCETKSRKVALMQLKKMPASTQRDEAIAEINSYHNELMNDCRAVLEAEKIYEQMQSN